MTIIELPLLEPPSPEALAEGRAAAEALIYETDWSSFDLARVVDPATEPISVRPVGSITTVYSPKGGAGTTFVAVNLAVALAREHHRVCLVDLDLQFGDVAITTQTQPVRGVLDAVGVELTDPVLAGMITTFAAGPDATLDCVLAPVDPAAAETVSAEDVRRLLRGLNERYDHVVVDTATQLSEQTLEALDVADRQLLITTPNISSIKSTRLLLDTLDLIGAPAQRRLVVVNQADPKDRTVADSVSESLRHDVIAAIPQRATVPASADLGVPLIIGSPKDPAAGAVRAVAVEHIAPQPAAPARRRFSLRRDHKRTNPEVSS